MHGAIINPLTFTFTSGYVVYSIGASYQTVLVISATVFSQPSIYIDGWLYATSMTSVVCRL